MTICMVAFVYILFIVAWFSIYAVAWVLHWWDYMYRIICSGRLWDVIHPITLVLAPNVVPTWGQFYGPVVILTPKNQSSTLNLPTLLKTTFW
jgi:hypothetical protein